MPTAAGIRTRFPGVFDSVTDASLNAAISAAGLQVNVNALGGLAEEASTLLACHFAELGKPGRASGQGRGKAGLVEIDFQNKAAETSFLRLYKQLVKRVIFPAGPVGWR